MNKRTNQEQQIERTLNSLDGVQRADPGAWFYGRVLNRLSQLTREETSPWSRIGKFLARPVVTIGGIAAVLVINLVLLVQPGPDGLVPRASRAAGDSSVETGLGEPDYVMANNSSFDSENLMQP